MDGTNPLNRHAQLRRELWNNVYVEYVKKDKTLSRSPAHYADKALAEFDKRFQPPKGY